MKTLLSHFSPINYSLRASMFVVSLLTSGATVQAEEPFDVVRYFVPSGWMGDGVHGTRYIDFNDAWRKQVHSPPAAIRVVYNPGLPGSEGWAGIYWQNKANNWGKREGEDFSQRGFARISFWAKGETGREVVEFKAGDIDALGEPHKDSFSATTGQVFLTTDWKRYEIDLAGKSLSSVIGGFAWVAKSSGNSETVEFFLDDIQYE